MNDQDTQIPPSLGTVLTITPFSSSQHIISTDEEINLLRKLQETTTAALSMSHGSTNPNYPHGGGSKRSTPDTKGKGHDYSPVFDGLLPRIETRGQSKQSSKKSSGKKHKGESHKSVTSKDAVDASSGEGPQADEVAGDEAGPVPRSPRQEQDVTLDEDQDEDEEGIREEGVPEVPAHTAGSGTREE